MKPLALYISDEQSAEEVRNSADLAFAFKFVQTTMTELVNVAMKYSPRPFVAIHIGTAINNAVAQPSNVDAIRWEKTLVAIAKGELSAIIIGETGVQLYFNRALLDKNKKLTPAERENAPSPMRLVVPEQWKAHYQEYTDHIVATRLCEVG